MSCRDSACVPVSSAWIASRRRRISPSSRFPSRSSASTFALWPAIVPVTCRVLASSRASSASRDEIVFDSAETPSSALRTLGAVPENVVEIASRPAASLAESTCPTVPARSSNAFVTS